MTPQAKRKKKEYGYILFRDGFYPTKVVIICRRGTRVVCRDVAWHPEHTILCNEDQVFPSWKKAARQGAKNLKPLIEEFTRLRGNDHPDYEFIFSVYMELLLETKQISKRRPQL